MAGTSGTTEPTWPTGERDTVVDNTVTWTEYGTCDEGGPYYGLVWNAASDYAVVFDIIKYVIRAMGWTLSDLAKSDGIIDSFYPKFMMENS